MQREAGRGGRYCSRWQLGAGQTEAQASSAGTRPHRSAGTWWRPAPEDSHKDAPHHGCPDRPGQEQCPSPPQSEAAGASGRAPVCGCHEGRELPCLLTMRGKCQAGQGAGPSEAKLIRPLSDCEALWSDPPCPASALLLVTAGLGVLVGGGGVPPGSEVKVKAAEMAMQCSPAPGAVLSVSPVTLAASWCLREGRVLSAARRARAPPTQAQFTARDPNCLRPHGSSSFD